MTTSEALDWMQSNHPTRTASAGKQAWYHPNQHNDRRPPSEYDIGVQPGFNGEPCQMFYGPSLEDCIYQIQEVNRLKVADESNNE